MFSKVTYVENMTFLANGSSNHAIVLDTNKENGGENKGVSPKELLLSGLAGCTGMDVVSILRKMQVKFNSFNIIAEADLNEEHPKVFTEIRISYLFIGDNLENEVEKIKKAINLSQEKYCGVASMLKKAVGNFQIKLIINDMPFDI